MLFLTSSLILRIIFISIVCFIISLFFLKVMLVDIFVVTFLSSNNEWNYYENTQIIKLLTVIKLYCFILYPVSSMFSSLKTR